MAAYLKGTTVLLIESDIDAALDLQDHLADEGVTIVTAYRKERALHLLQNVPLKGVVIERSVYEDDAELRGNLHERKIPHVVHHRAKPVAAVVAELLALVTPSSLVVIDRVKRRAPVVPGVADCFGDAWH